MAQLSLSLLARLFPAGFCCVDHTITRHMTIGTGEDNRDVVDLYTPNSKCYCMLSYKLHQALSPLCSHHTPSTDVRKC